MYNTTPSPHASAARVYGCFCRISGGAAYRVPNIVLGLHDTKGMCVWGGWGGGWREAGAAEVCQGHETTTGGGGDGMMNPVWGESRTAKQARVCVCVCVCVCVSRHALENGLMVLVEGDPQVPKQVI
jgi:hypothetical protein